VTSISRYIQAAICPWVSTVLKQRTSSMTTLER